MTVSKALPSYLIDGLLANYKKPEDLIGENGLLKQLTKELVERALHQSMGSNAGCPTLTPWILTAWLSKRA